VRKVISPRCDEEEVREDEQIPANKRALKLPLKIAGLSFPFLKKFAPIQTS
jgi:hypothetical protein